MNKLPLYDFPTENSMNEFLEKYKTRIFKITDEKLLNTHYDRNNIVRGSFYSNRETKFVCNQKIKIIKNRLSEILQSWDNLETGNLYIQGII